MNNLAVGVVAVSTTKQGQLGDSPESQRFKVSLLAKKRDLKIVEWFEFWESRAYEKQPIEKVIEYCKKNKVSYLLVMNFERFTRGGIPIYARLNAELKKLGVTVLDYEGVADTEVIDTLEHLGGNFGYDWSQIRPSEERIYQRVQDALNDRIRTLNKLIPKEIEYERQGFWMGGIPNYGYTTVREDTEHGKRALVVPLEKEVVYVKKIYERLNEGKFTDQQIVDEINGMGYLSRIQKKRHPDKNKKNIIIGYTGGVPLNIKQMYVYAQNPIYCGVLMRYRGKGDNRRKQKPVRLVGTPIVSVELWNKANKGKFLVSEDRQGNMYFSRGKIPQWRLFKNGYNELYPYKSYVGCSICGKPLYGSATTKPKTGKKYPGYHHHGTINGKKHFFRVKLDTFNKTIEIFVKNTKLKDNVIMRLKESYLRQFEQRRTQSIGNTSLIEDKIQDVTAQQMALIEKISMVNNPLVIKSLEEKIGKLENELGLLQTGRNKQESAKSNSQEAINSFWYYLEHLEELILNPANPIQNAKLFGLMFVELPTYEDLVVGTARLEPVFELRNNANFNSEPAGIRTQDQELKRLLLYH